MTMTPNCSLYFDSGASSMPSLAVSPNSPPISSIEKPVSVRSKPSHGNPPDLDLEQIVVPAAVLGQLVVGEHIGALLRRAPAAGDHHGRFIKAELLCRQGAAVARNGGLGAAEYRPTRSRMGSLA